MPYINNRIVHDADSHTMELPDWYDEFGTERVKEVFRKRFVKSQVGALESMEAMAELHKQEEYRALNEKEIMLRKNYQALGAFDGPDRSEAIDHLGVATQLVFPTSPNVWLEDLEHRDDMDFLYETASATNRSQIAFCDKDERLFPVCYCLLYTSPSPRDS